MNWELVFFQWLKDINTAGGLLMFSKETVSVLNRTDEKILFLFTDRSPVDEELFMI